MFVETVCYTVEHVLQRMSCLSWQCYSVVLFVLSSEDGISIPSDYTSYMAPLQSAKLYSEFRVNKDKDKHPEVRLLSLHLYLKFQLHAILYVCSAV